mmetsp:Transcript_7311/g.22443  ORF Transcript_7311/g.22443 Transcript_7311/m.22443 type:complete len:287 (+) Transcript_7311:1598-2458(+)
MITLQGLVRTTVSLAGAGLLCFGGLLAVLYRFQRNIIFPRPGPDDALPIRKGQSVTIDCSGDARPEGVPAKLVAVYFPPAPGKKTLAFWHGNADQIGNVGDHLGHVLKTTRGLGFYGVEYPGYALCGGGFPTEETILWGAARALQHLREALGVAPEDTVAFGQSIGGAVALQMTRRKHCGACVLLSSFASLPAMCREVFPFVPAPEKLVKDPFDCVDAAPDVDAPVLCLHGTRDEIVPYAQGVAVSKLLPRATLVSLRGAGHNDTFNGAAFRRVLDALDDFLKGLA